MGIEQGFLVARVAIGLSGMVGVLEGWFDIWQRHGQWLLGSEGGRGWPVWGPLGSLLKG